MVKVDFCDIFEILKGIPEGRTTMERLIVTALLCTVALSACGGGKSNTSDSQNTSENYYGRTLPQEPSNPSASLAGTDSNNNGVRDDVERALASTFKSDADFTMSMNGAAELQKILTDTGSSYSVVERKFTCSTVSLGETNQGLIRNIVFNTAERQSVIKNSSESQPTSVEITIDSSGNAVNPCSN